MAKVEVTEGCWLWTASLNTSGYGQLSQGRGALRPLLAHRVSWELFYGPIPEGMCVLHHCDTPACVRPHHLWLGTRADNNADMLAKGRKVGRGPNKVPNTHCQRGHLFTDQTEYWYKGRRNCITCRQMRDKNRRR